MITVSTGEQGEPLALRTCHQHERALQIRIQQGCIAFGSHTDHAVARVLEFLEGSVEIHNPRHRHVLQRPSCNLGHRAGEPCTSPLRKHHPMGAHGLC